VNGGGVRESRIAALSGLTAFFALLPWAAFAMAWKWYIWPLLFATAALVAASAVARTLRVPRIVVALAQLIVAAEAILIGVAGTWRPDSGAWATFTARMDASISVARLYEAPVPHNVTGLAPLMIVLGVGIVVAFDLLAATLRRPGLAGLLLLAVQTTTGALVDEPLSWMAFLLSALSFGALLASVREVSLIGWTSLRRGERSVGGVFTEDFNTRTASLRIGIVAAALAVTAPLYVPVYGSGTLQALKVDNGGNAAQDTGAGLAHPFLDMKRNLQERKAIPLVQINSGRAPSYFRYAVLDTFDGSAWYQGTTRVWQPQSPDVNPDQIPYAARSGNQTIFSVQTLPAYDATTLPAPYPPGSQEGKVEASGGQSTPLLVDQSTWEIKPASSDGSVAGYRFTAAEYQQDVSRSALNQQGSMPTEIANTYLQLPANLPSWVRQTANDVTSNGGTKFQKAQLLWDWFYSSGHFTYSLRSGTGSGLNQLHQFLTGDTAERVGYCEQFATA